MANQATPFFGIYRVISGIQVKAGHSQVVGAAGRVESDTIESVYNLNEIFPGKYEYVGPSTTPDPSARTGTLDTADVSKVQPHNAIDVALTDDQAKSRTDTTRGLIAGGKQLADREQALQMVPTDFDATDGTETIPRVVSAKTLNDWLDSKLNP